MADVSQGSLSDIEAGRVLQPSTDLISKVAEGTSFPQGFFYLGSLPDFPDGHYRRLKRGTSKVSKQVRAQVRQVVELVQRSEDHLRLPPITLEPVHGHVDIDAIESVAADARSALGVGARDPIPNVMRAAERAGVVVVRLPNEMEDHDGFSVWPDYGLGGRPIIAVAGGGSGDRDRFTVSHELGHLLLHTARGHIDSATAEAEANRFAACLLLPGVAAEEAIRPPVTLRVLMGVKATFGTSIQMGAQRALDLNLITHDHFVSLRKQLSARRWTQNEPVDVSPERPLLVSKILDNLAGEGSTSERAARLYMPVFTFRALAG